MPHRSRAAVVLWVVFGLSAALAGGCRSAPAPPPFNPDDPAVIAQIEAIAQSVFDGAAAVDVGKVLAPAAGPGELTFITGDVLLRGTDNIRPRFEQTYAGLQKQEHTVLDKQVRVLSPDVALMLVVAEGTYTDKAGFTSEPVGLGLTIVFVREDGAWRIRHAHQSVVQ